jgi:chromosome segregation protein
MKIKSIELIGFKSFYEKTVIHFHSRINAIVGPNGCGKSNILDAIRWILGEQNPRRLRAEGMEEVIANGGESLKPLGMAEVSLAITDVSKDGFDEIVIKRRLFRSGESEYYINGTPCRLKDITEMFMDTGIGARAYSNIGQGKVEHLLTTKPEERRGIIEEVAGLVKYKTRRRETESRIESTKENLIRVKDVTSEVNRQMNTLRRQAKDAERFKQLSQEVKNLESRALRAKLLRLKREGQILSDERSKVEVDISQTREKISQRDAFLKERESELLVLERSHDESEEETYKLKSDLQAKESFQELLRNEVSSVEEFIEKVEKEIDLLREEESRIETHITLKRRNLEEVRVILSNKETELRQKERVLSSLKSEAAKGRADLEATRTTLFGTLDRYSSLKGMVFGYDKELTELKSREERIQKELHEVKSEIDKTSSRISELELISKEIEEQRGHIDGEKKYIQADFSAMNRKQESMRGEARLLSERLNEVNSRLNVLKQIQSNYEWLPEDIRRFFLERKGDEILGLISDFISVPKGYERAIEAAFGDKLKWVLVKEKEEALKAIESLRELSIGRGTFIPIDFSKKGNGDFKKNWEDIIPLWEMVKVEGMDSSLIENMLKGVFVVSSLREAITLREEMEEGSSFVTLEGDLLDSSGAISGGFPTEGVFERKREIEELSLEASRLEERLYTISQEIELNQREVDRLQTRLEQLERELAEVGIRDVEIKKDIANLRDNLLRTQRRSEVVEFDLTDVQSQIGEREKGLLEIQETLKSLEDEKEDLEKKFKELEEGAQKSEEEESRLELEITNFMVENAALMEKEKGIREDLDELDHRLKEIRERIELETKEIEKKREEKLNLIKTGEDASREVENLLALVREKEEELSASKNRRNEVLDHIKKVESEREELRLQLNLLQEKSNNLGLQLKGLQMEMEHGEETIQKMGLEFDSHVDNGATASEEENYYDGHHEEARLRELREKIEGFGPVNLLAPEEYKSLEERHKFLNAQMEDLVSALSSLRKAINKIDTEYEKRFKECFDVINEKFQEVFSRLFRGGEAKLVLTDPEDILQTGVEVMVRPKGKRFQSVNLLSGGEKALSAIALVISACFVKPAPFLLLDEIDAPLDDANTAQFLDLLKDIASDSQVVIITHNKRTMQAVNALIGITSDKPGVSKVVSVELNGA